MIPSLLANGRSYSTIKQFLDVTSTFKLQLQEVANVIYSYTILHCYSSSTMLPIR